MKLLISLILLPLTVFGTDKFPKMKPGGWELSMNIPEMKFPIKSTYCIDETTQNKLLQSSQKDMGSCETPRFSRSGDTFTTETTCLEGGRKANIISTMNFSGDSFFTSNIKVTSDDGTQTLNGSGKHVGECPTGMNPGDVRVMNFSRENIEAMMRQFKRSSALSIERFRANEAIFSTACFGFAKPTLALPCSRSFELFKLKTVSRRV